MTLTFSRPSVTVEVSRPANTLTFDRSGPPGPNQITAGTSTDITGLLKGASGQIAQAVLGTDYTIYNSSSFNTDLATKTTDNLTQGSTNKYYSSSLFNTDFATKTTNDLTEGSSTTRKYSQWSRFTDGARTALTPLTVTDQLIIGPLTDLDAYGGVADAAAMFMENSETAFFTTAGHGASSFVNGGGIYVSMRSQGTANSPTAIGAAYGLGGHVAFGYDGTSYSQYGDSVILPGNFFYGDIIATGNVRQTYDILGGVNQTTTGVIRARTDNKLSFFRTATPVSQSTGWSVSNETSDKVFDADSLTLSELADVVGTLIEYLKTLGILGG